jgi:DNA polymerase elongation subunit (family B)
MKKDVFKDKWINDAFVSFKRMYPDISDDEILDFVTEEYNRHMVDGECELHNNYTNTAYTTKLSTLIDWIEDKKPICAGYGVFYHNQNTKANLDAVMLDDFMTTRKEIKGTLKLYAPDSYDYYYADSMQSSEKRKANSFYGTNLSKVAVFYNKYTGVSVTATGQSLISTAETAFEGFVAGDFGLLNMDDLCNYINICLSNNQISKYKLEDVSKEQLHDWLYSKMRSEYECIYDVIRNLSQEEVNRVYYVNNIFEVIKQDKFHSLLVKLVGKIDFYRDASKIPENAKEDLNLLWAMIKDVVFLDGFYFDRILRFKNDKRSAVILCDTDSCMVYINMWVEWMRDHVYSKARKPDDANTKFIAVSIKAFLMTNMIETTLEKYCRTANVLEEYIPKINMKNEFLMGTMALAATKKRYISTQLLREGREFDPPKYDAKGIDFLKGNTREATRAYFDKLSKEEILFTDEISIPKILNKLDEFQDIMRESLSHGKKDFTIPANVKEAEGYKNPLSTMNLLAVMAWNNFYPDNMISLPEIVDVVKVTLDKDKSLELLQEKYPDKYKIIEEKYLMDRVMKDKLPNAIAIPKSIEEIPEWIIDFIDYDTIIGDNINKFNSVRESLAIAPSKLKNNKTTYSNILEI